MASTVDTDNQASDNDTSEPVDLMEQPVPVSVYGEESTVTVRELVEKYQKATAADKLLADARRLHDENANAIKLAKDFKEAVTSGDRDAWTRVLRAAGQDEAAIQEYFTLVEEAAKDTSSTKKAPAFDEKALPPDYQDAAAFVKGLKAAGYRPEDVASIISTAIRVQGSAELRKHIAAGLKSSPQLTKILPQGADQETLVDLTEMYLNRRQQSSGQPLSATMLQEAIQDVAAAVSKLPLAKPVDPIQSLGFLPTTDASGHRDKATPQSEEDAFESYVTETLANHLRKGALTGR